MTAQSFAEFAKILPEPVIMVTDRGEILAANPLFLQIVSRTQKELTGINISEISCSEKEELHRYLKNCSRSRQMVIGALNLQDINGKTLEYRCEGAVIELAGDGHPAKIFLRFKPKESFGNRFILLTQKINELNREIFERKRAEKESRRLYKEALDANRLKDEFLATISHELRTPLNAVLGWARMLKNKNLSGEHIVKAIDTIERNACSQARLIEELLDISRIITGKLRLDVRPFEITPVIESAVETFRPAAENKSIRLDVVIDPQAGNIYGDAERIQQIIWNLLSNAVRFTPNKGLIQLSVGLVNSHIEIVVSDTGEGIASEFLPYVFDRFRQADASKTRKHGGLGVGMAIVRHLVELHGGTTNVFSDGIGQGATFTIKLPAISADEAEPVSVEDGRRMPLPVCEDAPEKNVRSELKNLHLLVVDDNSDTREMLSIFLENLGAIVTLAASSAEALTKLSQNSYDVLISDIEMPGEDGYVLIEKVRALSEAEHGKIGAIALTASARAADRTHALATGFDAHLAKPFDPNELITVITELSGKPAEKRNSSE